ncbi:DUF6559 family protein [Spongiimicrobium salis]|uniref:DUF6559 family protein n=1 Tax=Spongiimicrobium salis TaxID=1667022 RepID=UPI00374CD77B
MSITCPPAPPNKKEYIADIGKTLVAEYGKKKYYKPAEVESVAQKSKANTDPTSDYACWAMCVFSSLEDFTAHHHELGESCNYEAMKTEMLHGLSQSPTTSWMDIPDLDLDTSWLDFGEVFEGVFEGLGSFIEEIFTNV